MVGMLFVWYYEKTVNESVILYDLLSKFYPLWEAIRDIKVILLKWMIEGHAILKRCIVEPKKTCHRRQLTVHILYNF